MSDRIDLHPEVRRLCEENDLLRAELARLLTEADELVGIVKPFLLAEYQRKLGAFELKRLAAQCHAARIKRTLEESLAAVNRGGRPDLIAIEGRLDLEFVEWQARVREAAGRLEAARDYLNHLLPPADNIEFRKLYHALVKVLHPDVNPALTEDQMRLWHRVQHAYQHGDLEELRALTLLAGTTAPVAAERTSLEILRREQEILNRQIARKLKDLELAETQPPFSMRKELADESWVAAQRLEIEKQTAALGQQAAALTEKLNGLLAVQDNGYGKFFGNN